MPQRLKEVAIFLDAPTKKFIRMRHTPAKLRIKPALWKRKTVLQSGRFEPTNVFPRREILVGG
jgi:hypothetical protein